jgi:hypothetical protein
MITGTIIATVVAAVFSSFVAIIMSIYTNRKKEKERFDLQLEKILSYSMEYPYLEQKIFTDTWDKSLIAKDEKYQRYERYCSIVFNFIYDVCLWKKYKKKDIENYVGIKFWLWKHEKYWKKPSLEGENKKISGRNY